MDVLFNCPECGKSLAIDEKGRGLTVTCPDCRSAVVVPSSESQGSPVGVPVHDPPEVPRLRFRQEAVPTKDCPYCREPIPVDSLFCTHCGTDLREGRLRPVASPAVRFNASWVWLVLLAGLAYYGFRERQWIMERIHDWGFFRQAIVQVDPLLDLKIRANKGDRDAQFELANALCSSTGTAHDAHQAFQFYLKAADGGHEDAQGTLTKALMGAWRPETNAPVIWGWLREEAEGGNSEACYQLGLLYNMSEDFGIDQKAAVPWFKKASDGGHQEAMFTMAMFYYAGELVATNRGESARLLALVDPKRLPRAPEVLGLMTLAGDGVAKDIPKGILLLETAATNGRAQAATTLGRIYLTGEAVPKDEHKALQWFLRAGELGDARGMAKAGLLCGQANDVTLQKRSRGLIFAALSNNQQAAYSEILTHVSDSVVKELEARNPPLATNSMVQFRRVNGTLVRGTLKELGVAGPIVLMGTNAIAVPFTDLDVAGRTRCDLEFRSLLSRSFIMERIYALVEGFKPPEPKTSTNDLKSAIRILAEKGDADYQAYLGSLLLKDRGTATEGVEWLKKAAESGAPDGQYELGLAYYRGTGVPVDKQEAFRLFDLAADQDHTEALLASGQMLIAGAGCLKDEVTGVRRLRESALLWESDAILATGRYLYGDRWGSPDAAQAFAWFRLGSILGMPVAQYWLGRMFYEGKGISADYNRAIQWLSESASQGYQPAVDLLNNDAAHKAELAAARQDYLKEQADFSKRLEHIRTNPKYDTIVPAQRIPSAFGSSREKEAYQRFADNYMNRRFSSIGAAVDDAWRNVGRRSQGSASNIQFIRGDLSNERFREAVQGAMQGVIDWSEVEAYSRHGSTESPTSYRPSVSYARSRSYQDEVERTLWAGWLEAVQAAAMYPDLIQE